MNLHSLRAIFEYELARNRNALLPNIASPVISTALYFLVFGAALGTQVMTTAGLSYGAFIVPGLVMLTVLSDAAVTTAFGIFMPKFTGSVYEILSAPISPLEIMAGFIGAAVTKAIILATLIMLTGRMFVAFGIMHPFAMIATLILTSALFAFLGFLLGIWASTWQRLHSVVTLIVTPLMFLGGTFYSIQSLPPLWREVALLNPVVYLISGFRWSFYGLKDVSVVASTFVTLGLLIAGVGTTWYVLRKGYGLRS